MRTPRDWDYVFLTVAHVIAWRSKDPSTQVGSVLVDKQHVILAEGFNGPPPGIIDEEVPWETRPDKYGFIIHAEENAILTALDGYGRKRLEGATLYTTHDICSGCFLRAVRCDIARIVIPESAPDYPMSRFDCVKVSQIQACECYPKVEIHRIPYLNPFHVPIPVSKFQE